MLGGAVHSLSRDLQISSLVGLACSVLIVRRQDVHRHVVNGRDKLLGVPASDTAEQAGV